MRLFAKFFLCAAFVISVALLLSGYLLITFSHNSAINREVERAANQFQFDSFIVQAGLISGNELSQISSELSGLAAFFAEDGALIFSDPLLQTGITLPDEVSGNLRVMQIQTVENGSYITVSGQVIHGGTALYLLMATDIVVTATSWLLEDGERILRNMSIRLTDQN